MRRLHFAIMVLGPWESRAVAFVLGMFFFPILLPFSHSSYPVSSFFHLSFHDKDANLEYHYFFVSGCIIGVLLCMVFVLSIITYRLIRGKRTYCDTVDSRYVYDVIVFDRDAENIVLPLMLVAAEEINVKTPISAAETNKA